MRVQMQIAKQSCSGSRTSPHSASEHSTHNNNATVPFENIDSSTKSREDCRLLTRMSEKNLTVGMYVKMRQLEYQNRVCLQQLNWHYKLLGYKIPFTRLQEGLLQA